MSTQHSGAGSAWQERLVAGDTTLHIHLIGIGGSGLSAIANVLLERGFRVSGSDRQSNPAMQRLAQAGARVFPDQTSANFDVMPGTSLPDLVLVSSAIGSDNPERQAAVRAGNSNCETQ